MALPVVPTPQLVEEFEDLTITSPSVVTGSVALSTTNPKFGTQCAVVQSAGGCRLEYPESQLPIAITRFQLGVWVRLDAQPPDTLAAVNFIEVLGITAAAYLRIKTTETTPGLNDRFQWKLGSSFGTAFALPVGVWRYLELRGTRSPGAGTGADGQPQKYWTLAARLHGVDQHNTYNIAFGEEPSRTVVIDYPASPAGPGMIMGLDRWWWWVGTDADPFPEWWSSVLGWDATFPLASISAGLRPGYHASLVSRNDRGVI